MSERKLEDMGRWKREWEDEIGEAAAGFINIQMQKIVGSHVFVVPSS